MQCRSTKNYVSSLLPTSPRWSTTVLELNTNILGRSEIGAEKAKAWARSRRCKDLAILSADLTWEIAPRLGVRPEVAYAQQMKETGFFKFGGVLDERYHNVCGLKTPAGGGNYDPNAHTIFYDWSMGILAQVEHLALYAGAWVTHLGDAPTDPRHFPYLHGRAKTVEELSNNWAGAGYGQSLRDHYLATLMSYRF